MKKFIFFLLMTLFFADTAFSKTQILIEAGQKIKKVNPFVMGNNVQWVDNADGLYDPRTKSFNTAMIEKLQKLKILSLRFPGGTLSDGYHWKDAVGPIDQRKKGLHVSSGVMQESTFGTDEFLELCRILKSGPIITVNTRTGTPQEAADWVRYCRGQVHYWEIGNEPYLEPSIGPKTVDPSYPDQFAKTFIEFAQAMKAADPNIKVGLPLRNDKLGRYPSGPYQNWNARMKEAVPYADFFAVHNAYFPAIFNQSEYKGAASLLALAAADGIVKEDLSETKNFLKSVQPNRYPLLAVTEFNSFVAMPHLAASSANASLASGLYTASLLIQFFNEPSVILAEFWSLNGNWLFGTLNQKGEPRPQYYALKIFSDFVGQEIVNSRVTNDVFFNTEAAGFLPAKQNVEAVQAFASSQDNILNVIIVNRSQDTVNAALDIRDFGRIKQVQAVILNGPSLESNNEQTQNVQLKRLESSFFEDFSDLKIPAHCVIAVRIYK